MRVFVNQLYYQKDLTLFALILSKKLCFKKIPQNEIIILILNFLLNGRQQLRLIMVVCNLSLNI